VVGKPWNRARPVRTPSRNDPLTLMASVAQGNALSAREEIAPSRR
jgi:hypothetical protein